jgi:hypothetical protein
VEPQTGHMVIVIAGLRQFGNVASSELLIDAKELDSIAQRSGHGWETQNLQLVLGATVIDRSPGHPKILETHFWPR